MADKGDTEPVMVDPLLAATDEASLAQENDEDDSQSRTSDQNDESLHRDSADEDEGEGKGKDDDLSCLNEYSRDEDGYANDGSVDSVGQAETLDERPLVPSNAYYIQFFAVHEVLQAFEHGKLLSSSFLKKTVDTADESEDRVTFFFVFPEIEAIIGIGTKASTELENEGDNPQQEPFEINFTEQKLVLFRIRDFPQDSSLRSSLDELLAVPEWEIKAIVSQDDQAQLRDAISTADQETVDSLKEKYEKIIQLEYSADVDTEGAEGVEGAEGAEAGNGSPAGDTPIDMEAKSSSRSEKKRKGSEVSDGGASSGPGQAGDKDKQRADQPQRSRIPFNVIGMTYEQYCAKHYELAIEQYRREKTAKNPQAQQQPQVRPQAQWPGMGGMPPMAMSGAPMGHMGGMMMPGMGPMGAMMMPGMGPMGGMMMPGMGPMGPVGAMGMPPMGHPMGMIGGPPIGMMGGPQGMGYFPVPQQPQPR